MKNDKELTFDEAKHEYRLDGAVLPSVTQIMKPLNDAEYEFIGEGVLKIAADRGTAVHSAIECLVKYGVEEIESEYQGYLDAFKKWRNDYKPEFLHSEYRMYHPVLMYAGTLDAICRIDGRLTVVDFKTTSALHVPKWAVQMEAYTQMAKANDFEIRAKQVLQIRPDGTYRVENMPSEDAVAWRVFASCQTIHNFIKKGI